MALPIEALFGGARGTADRRRPPFFRTKKVALLGATDSLQYAPWDDPSWTLIAHPCCRKNCKREPDWYFDMHPRACFEHQKKSWHPDYYKWLTSIQTPVFMQENYADVPMAVRYPKERILAEFRPYFTNHCAWMIALAMTEGVTHIGLFGCQYAGGGERERQRESLLYWVGRFEQAGGTIVLPQAHNTLMTMPLYGYASHDEKTGKLVQEYSHKPVMAKPTGERIALTPVADAPSERVPLMMPPTGEPIAWERSGHLVYA